MAGYGGRCRANDVIGAGAYAHPCATAQGLEMLRRARLSCHLGTTCRYVAEQVVMRKSSCDGSRIARMVAQAMSKSGGGAAVLNSCSNVFGKYEVFTLSQFAEKKMGGDTPPRQSRSPPN